VSDATASTERRVDEATDIAVTPGPLVGPVLRRVVGMMAARANLPLDKLDEAVLIADVIAHRAGPYAADAVQVSLHPGEGTLWMRVGPLSEGGAQALLEEEPDVGTVILKVADEVQVDTGADGEYLRVCVTYGG
jgi:hypothetical protein